MVFRKTSFDVRTRYIETVVSIPAKTNSQSTTLPNAGFRLVELQCLYPQGHVNLTGFRLTYQGVTILPWNQSTGFLLGNDERRTFDMQFQMNVDPVLVTRNLDNVVHSLIFVSVLQDLKLDGDTVDVSQVTSMPIVLG